MDWTRLLIFQTNLHLNGKEYSVPMSIPAGANSVRNCMLARACVLVFVLAGRRISFLDKPDQPCIE